MVNKSKSIYQSYLFRIGIDLLFLFVFVSMIFCKSYKALVFPLMFIVLISFIKVATDKLDACYIIFWDNFFNKKIEKWKNINKLKRFYILNNIEMYLYFIYSFSLCILTLFLANDFSMIINVIIFICILFISLIFRTNKNKKIVLQNNL